MNKNWYRDKLIVLTIKLLMLEDVITFNALYIFIISHAIIIHANLQIKYT